MFMRWLLDEHNGTLTARGPHKSNKASASKALLLSQIELLGGKSSKTLHQGSLAKLDDEPRRRRRATGIIKKKLRVSSCICRTRQQPLSINVEREKGLPTKRHKQNYVCVTFQNDMAFRVGAIQCLTRHGWMTNRSFLTTTTTKKNSSKHNPTHT